ncbi:hypothetical protein CCR94_21220 [Rhodoblastus sphagnicola]|uniref:Uncharacterized protein n=1 Tax=Rhodoblastus sphagnicola TaxID=333368 RepID=A0A2S6MX60_9HYPH|nr:twin-arginine translocation signal domain-containing protein [Rhodoblastus sphagnicola]MBB4199277.1 hypothetical protein [Rhodoblastus sphagnicola]PPQ26946.1 hypothetical protein CCR94_21220 [Rhodoblastus sphagnicola]
MTISRRHLLTAVAAGAATAALPFPAWSAPHEILTLADETLRATFSNALIIREPAQLRQAADWLAAAPNRALTGLLSDADGVLLMQMVARGSARWLWSDHHVFKDAPSSVWLRATAQDLARLERAPATASTSGAGGAWFSFAAQS